MENNYSFNKRYLVIGVIIFIISVYLALNIDISDINPKSFYIYSACFSGVLSVIGIFLYIVFRKDKILSSGILSSFALILVFIIGFSRTFYFSEKLNADRNLLLNSIYLKGQFVSATEISSSGKSIAVYADIYETSSPDNSNKSQKPIKALLYFPVEEGSSFEYGETFECSVNFPLSTEPSYDGDFDYSRYLMQKKVCGTVYCSSYKTIDESFSRSLTDRFEDFGIKLRMLISASCNSSMYSSDEAALLKGIMLGDISGMSDTLYDSYTDSGLIHITSVSGMHTSYLFIVISFILAFLKIPRKLYPFISIPILVLFSAIALFTPSVSRSVIMLSVLLLAPIFFRKNDTITALFISAAIIIFNNPYSLESYSFLLSYGATLGILLFTVPLSAGISSFLSKIKRKKYYLKLKLPLKYSANSIALSVSGIIGTAYFSARFFGRISLSGILANLLITPLVAISFIGGYINCLIYYISVSLSESVALFVLKPVLFLTNIISTFFGNGILSLDVPRSDKGFFIVYIVIVYMFYILLTNKKTADKQQSE